MFHRVLNPADPRWQVCDPEYTLSVELFAESLKFFKRHYNVVSLDQVLDAQRSARTLPPRALLITLDDGWADNAEFALPELRRVGLPAVLFVVADAIGRTQPFFQERMVSAWRRGVLRVADVVAALPPPVSTNELCAGEDMAALRSVIGLIEKLDLADREALLDSFSAALDDGMRHMVSIADLQSLQQGGVALGLHGKTHTPMTQAEDLDAELAGARTALARQLGQAAPNASSMSFPHGAYDSSIATRARDAGYKLVFTSKRVTNPASPAPGWLLGRSGFESESVVDQRGRFRPDLLALHLFRLEHCRLA